MYTEKSLCLPVKCCVQIKSYKGNIWLSILFLVLLLCSKASVALNIRFFGNS